MIYMRVLRFLTGSDGANPESGIAPGRASADRSLH